MTNVESDSLDFFRKEVSFLYREIGILKTRNHPELAAKARLDGGFFSPSRKSLAKDYYHQTKTQDDPSVILKPYVEHTGLDLEDIYRIFDEGDWKNSYGGYSYGGPKWAKIAKNALELRDAIDRGDWDEAWEITRRGKSLEHNNGLLVNKFSELQH